MKFLAVASFFAAAAVAADVATYGQCGGSNYKGSTKCASSSDTCKYSNEWYSQCVPKSSGSTPTSSTKKPTTTLSPSKPAEEVTTYVDISVWYSEDTDTVVGTQEDGSQIAVVVSKDYPIYVDESALATDNVDIKYATTDSGSLFAVVFAA